MSRIEDLANRRRFLLSRPCVTRKIQKELKATEEEIRALRLEKKEGDRNESP